MHRITLLILIALTILTSACGSYKHIPYFQDLSHAGPSEQTVDNYVPFTIQPADIPRKARWWVTWWTRMARSICR
jgi:polysaccharide export outer membrane protein